MISPRIAIHRNRRTFLFLIFLCGWVTGALPQDDSLIDTSDIDDIAEPVVSVRFEECWFTNQNGENQRGDRYVTSLCLYNEAGLLQERRTYAGEDKLTGRCIRKYDDQNRIISESKYKNHDTIIDRVQFSYNDKGQIIEKKRFRLPRNIEHSIRYQYNAEGQVTEKSLWIDNKFKRKTVLQYTAEGYLASTADYDPEGHLEAKEEYRYDARGNRTHQYVVDKENQVIASMQYRVNEKGQTTEVTALTKGDKIEMRRCYAYDDRGHVSKMTAYGRGGHFLNCEIYHYEYDRHGYWIVKQERTARPDINLEKPVREIYRIITYKTSNTNPN